MPCVKDQERGDARGYISLHISFECSATLAWHIRSNTDPDQQLQELLVKIFGLYEFVVVCEFLIVATNSPTIWPVIELQCNLQKKFQRRSA
jgi:hypothetical protein